ncbi:MAG: hypothetical protein HZA91_21040 [Verrucomicrobia bacterium]|nr:hypothetical protein [Verrucomicrobiota bacterium]
MNLRPSTLAAAALTLALAGCMEKMPSQWGFRYEDRDRVVEAADKLEALATNLYNMSRRPLDYSAKPESAGLNAIRFFAAEAARFHRAARAWQPGSPDIGFAYNNLTDRWNMLRGNPGTLQVHEQAHTYIQRINELMQDLGRFAAAAPPSPMPRGPAATGAAKTPPSKTAKPPAPAPPPPAPEPAATPRVAPAPATTPSPLFAPPQPAAVEPPPVSPPPAMPSAPAPAPSAPAAPPAPPPVPEEKPPLLPPLAPIAPNPGVR